MVVVLALCAAALFALAAVLEQRAAAAPSAVGLLRRVLRSPLWYAGLAADVAAFGVQALALHRGSLTVVQPLLVTVLLFSLPLAALGSGKPVRAADGTGALALCAGLALFLTFGAPHGGRGLDRDALLVAAGVIAVAVAALVVAARRATGRTRPVLLAVAAAAAFALTAAFVKALTATLADAGPLAVLTDWTSYGLTASSLVGLALEQAAFAAGPLTPALATLIVADPLISAALGAGVYGDRLHTGAAAAFGAAVGAALGVAGALLLARSPSAAADPAVSGRVEREARPA